MKVILTTTANQQLPYLTETHINEWLPLITERAFVLWLKLLVQANNKPTFKDEHELSTKLMVDKNELKDELLPILYSVGLVDIEEVRLYNVKTYKKLTVHPFPYNDSKKQLIKNRQYKEKGPTIVKEPLKLIDVLTKHHNKLWQDGVDKAVLFDLLKAEKKTSYPLTETEFARVVDEALSKSKTKIGSKGNATGYFKAVIRNYKETKLKNER